MTLNTIPLVVVLGTTATGKSKLALELAKRFGGEIISADSMQVYKGLSIVTNKVTPQEQAVIKHHLLDVIEPHEKYSVIDFKRSSIPIIDNLIQEKKMPIVVGGTHYYIESILWKNFVFASERAESENQIIQNFPKNNKTLLDFENIIHGLIPESLLHKEEDCDNLEVFFSKPILHSSFFNIPSQKLWSVLDQIDPDAAAAYHPNNRRRVIRCLQVIQEQRRNYSEVLNDLNKIDAIDKMKLGGPLRYRPTCVFWLHCDKDILKDIIQIRVEEMIANGLLSEIESFYHKYNQLVRHSEDAHEDYEKGILQTIGFKEFIDYLKLDEQAKKSDTGKKCFSKAVDEMVLSTVQYSKRQIRWIKRRLILSESTRELPKVYKLDISTCWDEKVLQPAIRIVDALIYDKDLDSDLLRLEAHKHIKLSEIELYSPGKHYCEACDRLIIGNHSINSHLNSKSHIRKCLAHRAEKEQ